MPRHYLAGFPLKSIDGDSSVYDPAPFGSVTGSALSATQKGLVSAVRFNVLIKVDRGKVPLLDEYITMLVDFSLVEPA
jgi:hypothetical protein